MPSSSKSRTLTKTRKSAPKPRRKKKQSGKTWKEVFSNLSPWGYTKLLAALILLAGITVWAIGYLGYYSGMHLHNEQLEAMREKRNTAQTRNLDRHIKNLDERYNLSFLQKRKAREIYTPKYMNVMDEWAKGKLAENKHLWRDLEYRLNSEFFQILSDKQKEIGFPK